MFTTPFSLHFTKKAAIPLPPLAAFITFVGAHQKHSAYEKMA